MIIFRYFILDILILIYILIYFFFIMKIKVIIIIYILANYLNIFLIIFTSNYYLFSAVNYHMLKIIFFEEYFIQLFIIYKYCLKNI